MLRTPDGSVGIEPAMFHVPRAVRSGPVDTPANTLGLGRVMFAVDDIDDVGRIVERRDTSTPSPHRRRRDRAPSPRDRRDAQVGARAEAGVADRDRRAQR